METCAASPSFAHATCQFLHCDISLIDAAVLQMHANSQLVVLVLPFKAPCAVWTAKHPSWLSWFIRADLNSPLPKGPATQITSGVQRGDRWSHAPRAKRKNPLLDSSPKGVLMELGLHNEGAFRGTFLHTQPRFGTLDHKG